jgi:lipoyl(octanoyl) transferase
VHALLGQLWQARRAGKIGDTVLCLEHEPVITLGRGTRPGHLLASRPELGRLGVDLVDTDRGGDITLHAPGQLIVYPIVDLAPDRCDVRRWVTDLALSMQRTVRRYGIDAGLVPGLVGLWVDRKSPGFWPDAEHAAELAKIGAIGVKISRWITLHGCALNLSTDLSLFRLIVPCGIREHGVTSVAELVGTEPDPRQAARVACEGLGERLGAETSPLEEQAQGALEALLVR